MPVPGKTLYLNSVLLELMLLLGLWSVWPVLLGLLAAMAAPPYLVYLEIIVWKEVSRMSLGVIFCRMLLHVTK